MAAKTKNYQTYLIESLKDPKEMAAYLNAALEDGNTRVFLLALRNVAEALGGVTKIAKRTKLNRTSLYRTLSKTGNPELASLTPILKAFGLKLAVQVEKNAA
jgi:probable addiction module antidote protein